MKRRLHEMLFIVWLALLALLSAAGLGFTAKEVVFDNRNEKALSSKPLAESRFRLEAAYKILTITTVHFNQGRGAAPGRIALRDEAGRIYGPWPAAGEKWRGAKNVCWLARPLMILPAGRYAVLDSEPETWSHNEASDNRGFTRVRGIRVQTMPFQKDRDVEALLKFFGLGLLVGLTLAASAAGINARLVSLSLTWGKRSGLKAALGLAAGQVLYAIVALLGLPLAMDRLIEQQFYLSLMGGGVMLGWGLKCLFIPASGGDHPPPLEPSLAPQKRGGPLLLGFAMALKRTWSVLILAGVMAALCLGHAGRHPQPSLSLLLGLFIGAALWGGLTSGGLGFLRPESPLQGLARLDRAAGLLFFILALAAWATQAGLN